MYICYVMKNEERMHLTLHHINLLNNYINLNVKKYAFL